MKFPNNNKMFAFMFKLPHLFFKHLLYSHSNHARIPNTNAQNGCPATRSAKQHTRKIMSMSFPIYKNNPDHDNNNTYDIILQSEDCIRPKPYKYSS